MKRHLLNVTRESGREADLAPANESRLYVSRISFQLHTLAVIVSGHIHARRGDDQMRAFRHWTLSARMCLAFGYVLVVTLAGTPEFASAAETAHLAAGGKAVMPVVVGANASERVRSAATLLTWSIPVVMSLSGCRTYGDTTVRQSVF